MTMVQTHLWFESKAEEAMKFYTSVFKDSKVLGSTQLPDSMAVFRFELAGMPITALNAGSRRPFNEAVSLYVETEDQAETDYYWDALRTGGGAEQPCGWLTDRFGVFWQVTPKALLRLLGDPDKQKVDRVLQAMYKMKKIIVADLERAYRG